MGKIVGTSVLELSAVIDSIIIQTLSSFDIKSFPKPDSIPVDGSGVWVKHKNKFKKIASRGLKVCRSIDGITQFGFALNVTTDLDYFAPIYPCGLDREMASMKSVSGGVYSMREVKEVLDNLLREKFDKK